MHPEKVISRGFRTGVRLPSDPPKQKSPHAGLFCFAESIKRGVERSPKNNPVNCFGDGDRRFLRDVTFEMIQNVEKKSRTTPLGSSLTAMSHANGVDLFFDGSELRRPRISAQTEKMREIVLGYVEMLREG